MRGETAVECGEAGRRIAERRFADWRGLPTGCSPDRLFGAPLDATWGEARLGGGFESAQVRLLDLHGYYRPTAYVRDGAVVLFDGANPSLEGGWESLSPQLGSPDAVFDWTHSGIAMAAGERVHAARGVTVWLNPENAFVVHISLYASSSVDQYIDHLRPPRGKRRDD